MKLGPIQKEWIKSLKEHPERQLIDRLGIRTENDYKACCLGEFLCTYHRMNNLPLPFDECGDLVDRNSIRILHSYKKLGLFSKNGNFIKKKNRYTSLARMNDAGVSWTEIALFVEKYPELVFSKSV